MKARSPEEVLADLREEAAILRRAGHTGQASRYLEIVDALTAAMPDYLTWLSEDSAAEYSGHHPDWLRARYVAWEKRDMAKQEGRRRFYRRCVLEHRGNTDAAREAGRRAIREDAA